MFVSSAPDVLAERPLELIEREIESLGASVNAGMARWLELVAEFDRREGWSGSGCRSTSEWIAWRCAVSPRAARENVRVARCLAELPATRGLFAAGELSYSKVRVITRIATPHSEDDLIELARHATAAQLERMVRAARRVTSAEADEAHRGAFVRWFWDDDDGCLHVDAKLASEDGALFLRALEAAQEQVHELYEGQAEEETNDAGGPAGPRTVPFPTNAEALTAMAENSLARSTAAKSSSAERYQVFVHVDAAALTSDDIDTGTCAIADGPGIAPETARRLACDCSMTTIAGGARGEPLNVGRRTRSIPPSIRRALVARDGRCQFPGCERHRFVDAHHIRHWARGGETSLGNLVLLCNFHHRLVHEGGYSVTTIHGRRQFARPDGAEVTSARPPEQPPRPLPRAGPLLAGSGEAMDLAACTDAVLWARRRGPG